MELGAPRQVGHSSSTPARALSLVVGTSGDVGCWTRADRDARGATEATRGDFVCVSSQPPHPLELAQPIVCM